MDGLLNKLVELLEGSTVEVITTNTGDDGQVAVIFEDQIYVLDILNAKVEVVA